MGKNSHEKMIVWQMADKLDFLTQKYLRRIPEKEYKLKSQIDSASDSVGANFVEGYYNNSLKEYIRFCRYSRRSVAEVLERFRRALRKNFLSEQEFGEIEDCAIKTGYLFDRLIQSLEKIKVLKSDS